MGKRIPRLGAVASGNVWKVWCVYCERWHTHGPGAGHRAAHCDSVKFDQDGRWGEISSEENPYIETGYILVAPCD